MQKDIEHNQEEYEVVCDYDESSTNAEQASINTARPLPPPKDESLMESSQRSRGQHTQLSKHAAPQNSRPFSVSTMSLQIDSIITIERFLISIRILTIGRRVCVRKIGS